MKKSRTRKPGALTLLSLGPEMDAALEEIARRHGRTKSESARAAIKALAECESGYREAVLVEVLILFTEIVDAAGDLGLLTNDDVWQITFPIDKILQVLYGALDDIDGLSSVHSGRGKGEAVRPYADVMKIRALRQNLVAPETEPLERLRDHFYSWLPVEKRQRHRKSKGGGDATSQTNRSRKA